MAKQAPDADDGGSTTSPNTFNDLKKAIAERNEQAHKEAREIRAAREREKLGILGRHKVDLDR
jgi:hypothetical protein